MYHLPTSFSLSQLTAFKFQLANSSYRLSVVRHMYFPICRSYSRAMVTHLIAEQASLSRYTTL